MCAVLAPGSMRRLRRHANGGVGGAVLLVVPDTLNEFEEEAPIEGFGIGVQEFAVVILVIGEVTAFASFFAAQIILTAHGGTELPAGASIVTQVKSASIPVVTIMSPGVLQAVVLSGVYLVLLSILALGLGFIIRSTAGAISIYVGILLVLPIILNFFPSGFKNSVEPYMPSNLGIAMVVTTTRTTDWAGVLLTPWVAVLVLAIYAAVFLLAGLWFLQRRDA